ncbi:hypothetical protein [Streptomyces sp. RB17]|uniref:hypothetical protein n=1 Tax=Streptomyces sp. RB17 TaxID=2585197 RepID=UPI002B204E24|nr:hypothetical protein [Streptomyces sp. RB17]
MTAVLCAVAAMPGGTAAGGEQGTYSGVNAAASSGASPGTYAFAPDARSVTGAAGTADAPRLEAGRTYRSSLPGNGKLYYRLDLDATSDAYGSVTAIPRAGTEVSANDGIKVSLQDADHSSCSVQATRFGTSRSAHPVAAWGTREASRGSVLCQGAGTYYLVVERADAATASPDAWDLEIAVVTEPRLKSAEAPKAPEGWDSASPQPMTGDPVERPGGAGFASARPLGQGVWRDDLTPGQTAFYKVPVDWGQQLYATAELGGSSGASGYVSGALTMTLYNPVRGYVQERNTGYDGRQVSYALAVLPPVRYANRYAIPEQVRTMRFAGSYYLVVHLAAQVADEAGQGPRRVTLHVRVRGAAQAGPGYAGSSEPRGVFDVTAGDLVAAGGSGGDRGSDTVMTAVAVSGIGAGTVLLGALGVWTVAARRRSRE